MTIQSSARLTGTGPGSGILKSAVRESKLIGQRLRTKFLAAYLHDEPFDLESEFVQEMLPLVSKVMIITHDKGWEKQTTTYPKKVREKAKAKGVSLDIFDTLIKNLRSLQDPAYVRQITKKYQTQALRILSVSGRSLEERARAAVNDVIKSGVPTSTGTQLLKERFDALGITKQPYQLEGIYRTQASIAYNAGRWEADQQDFVQEVLWGYEYSAIGDDRTREEHLALDGTILPKEDIFWRKFWPPNGWNCRCTTLPIFTEEKIKQPPSTYEVDGKSFPVEPDKGFNINFGHVFQSNVNRR